MTDPELQNRLKGIHQRIQSACERAKRDPKTVTIVSVTKFFPQQIARKACASGLTHFGENKVQEALEKYGDGWLFQVNQTAQLHMIGHLQSNKVRKAVQLFTTLDSVDSIKLAKAIESEAELAQKQLRVLLEVNTSGEPQKYGLALEEVNEVVSAIKDYKYIKLAGLMTIGPNTVDTQQIRQSFKNLKNLFDKVKQNHSLHYWSVLSMGMSHDFEIAIEEGATEIRLGSALFGERS